MGEDLSQGAKIGIILIILCALIAIVFSIMSIMKNITSSGVEDLQVSLGSMTGQKFDDYDQRTVTGAQVIAVCKMFQNQPLSIYVYTNRKPDAPTVYGANNMTLVADSYSYDADTKTVTVPGGYVTGALPTTSAITYNNNRKNMSDKSSNEYVANSSKFYSYLVKSTSGDTIGILFDEM